MPRSYYMTWEPSRSRWRKLYKGKLYWVTCRDLHAPPTKDGSYKQANAWWVQRRAEVEGYNPPSKHEGAVEVIQERLAWAQANNQRKLADRLRATIEELRRLDDLHPWLVWDQYVGPAEVRRRWEERTGKSPPLLPLDESPTLGHHVDRWKETQHIRAQLGQISVDRNYNVVDQIDRFANSGSRPSVC